MQISKLVRAIAHGYDEIPQVHDGLLKALESMQRTPSGDFSAGYNQAIRDVIQLVKERCG